MSEELQKRLVTVPRAYRVYIDDKDLGHIAHPGPWTDEQGWWARILETHPLPEATWGCTVRIEVGGFGSCDAVALVGPVDPRRVRVVTR